MSHGRKELRRSARKKQRRVERDHKNSTAKKHRRAEHFGQKHLAVVNRSLDDLLPTGATFGTNPKTGQIRINLDNVPRDKLDEVVGDIAKRLNISPDELHVHVEERRKHVQKAADDANEIVQNESKSEVERADAIHDMLKTIEELGPGLTPQIVEGDGIEGTVK